MAKTTAVLLVNLGTPDSPKVSDVRSYLSQFLNDPRVIDIPWLLRKILVNLIIVPFRAPRSAKIYRELWTERGSPIIFHSKELSEKLQDSLGDEYSVYLAMRYKNPSLNEVLDKIRRNNHQKLVVVPLFPQYASATTGSVMEEVMRIVSGWWVMPEIRMVNQFYDHPLFIDAWVEIGSAYNWREYDHVMFSYHGLPVRQVDKVYDDGLCEDHDCEREITEENKYCYKATSYATTRLMTERLGIPEENYTVCFQSRLDKKWLEPFSDKVVIEKAKEGMKRLLVFSPAFTADCLETIIEIGDEYQEIFEEHGGEEIQLVPSLNSHPLWVKCLHEMVRSC